MRSIIRKIDRKPSADNCRFGVALTFTTANSLSLSNNQQELAGC
jgi:hypothetical protein